jgi:hypothetical protein
MPAPVSAPDLPGTSATPNSAGCSALAAASTNPRSQDPSPSDPMPTAEPTIPAVYPQIVFSFPPISLLFLQF